MELIFPSLTLTCIPGRSCERRRLPGARGSVGRGVPAVGVPDLAVHGRGQVPLPSLSLVRRSVDELAPLARESQWLIDLGASAEVYSASWGCLYVERILPVTGV